MFDILIHKSWQIEIDTVYSTAEDFLPYTPLIVTF